MEKYLKKIKPKYYWLIAFLLTALTYTMAFSYMGLLGNGTYVISRSDLQQQYIQFIEYYYFFIIKISIIFFIFFTSCQLK